MNTKYDIIIDAIGEVNGVFSMEKESFSVEEQNPFYSPEKANNGGGYHQPLKKYTFRHCLNEYSVIYNDTSIGDFGRRYKIDIVVKPFATENKIKICSVHVNRTDVNIDNHIEDVVIVKKYLRQVAQILFLIGELPLLKSFELKEE